MTIEEMKKQKLLLRLTNEELARLSGVPLGTVQKVMSGNTPSPRYATLQALETVLAPKEAVLRETAGSPGSSASGNRIPGNNPPGSYASLMAGDGMVRESAAYSASSPESRREKQQGTYTVADYLALPGERRAELIDGVFYDMRTPTVTHQQLSALIHHQLADFIDAHGLNCIPGIAPTDVQLDRDDKTLLQPDVFVTCDRGKITPARIFGAPDLIIEVLSPSTRARDMHIKWEKYEKAGVREYWLVNPRQKQIITIDFARDSRLGLYSFEDEVPVSIWNGECMVDFRKIYEKVRFLYEQEGVE